MAITYTVDKKNVVCFFGEDLDTPFILQDVHPEGREWADKAEATAWAEAWIADREAALARANTAPTDAPADPAPTAKP